MIEKEIYELLQQGEIIEVDEQIKALPSPSRKLKVLSQLIEIFKEEVADNIAYSVFDYSVDINELYDRHINLEKMWRAYINEPSEYNKRIFDDFIRENNISNEYVMSLRQNSIQNKRVIYETFSGEKSLLPYPYAPLYTEEATDYLCFTTRTDVTSSFWQIIVIDKLDKNEIAPYLEKYEKCLRVSEDYILFGPLFEQTGLTFAENIPSLSEVPGVGLDTTNISKTYDSDGNYIFRKNPIYKNGKYDGREKILTIGVPVSNQITTIEACMKGISPILNKLDAELLVIDTGSTDGTIEVCKKYGARIIEYPWCDNMSKVRNIGINYALGDWYMSIDDDEYFDNVDDIIAFFKTGEYKSYERATYIQRNYTSAEGNEFIDKYVLRMGKITPELHFEGRIHDALYPISDKASYVLMSAANHYGFIKDDKRKVKEKYLRNTKILLKDVCEMPANLRYTFQLANEIKNVGIFDYAAKFFLKGFSIALEAKDIYWGKTNAVSLISSLYALQDDRLFHTAEMLLTEFSYTHAEKAYIYYCLADLGDVKKIDNVLVAYYCNEYLKWMENYKLDSLDSDANTFIGLHVCKKERYSQEIRGMLEKRCKRQN